MIKLTVALPVWNSREILWLALESLCRQEKPDFDWELLIAEEKQNAFGLNAVNEYTERLKDVGCMSLRYFKLDYKIELANKWGFLAEEMSPDSLCFVMHSADCYSEKRRLIRTMEKIEQGHDWIQNRRTYFYSLQYNKMLQFDQTTFGDGCTTGANMAIASNLVKNLPPAFISKGIDRWLLSVTNPQSIHWVDDDIPDNLDTDGLNNISKERRHLFKKIAPPFVTTTKVLREVVPIDIAKRLEKTKSREHHEETYKLYGKT